MQISAVVLLVATLFVVGSHQTPDGGCGCGSRNVQEVARVKREEPELRPGNCNCARCDAGKPCGCGCGNGGGKIFEVLVQERVKRQDETPEPVVVVDPTAAPPVTERPGRGGGRGGGRGRPIAEAGDDSEIVAQPGFVRPVGRPRPRPRPRRPNPFF